MQVTVLQLERPLHAKELVQQLDLGSTDLLACVGGDGTIWEALQVGPRAAAAAAACPGRAPCQCSGQRATQPQQRRVWAEGKPLNPPPSSLASAPPSPPPHRACSPGQTGSAPGSCPSSRCRWAPATAWPPHAGLRTLWLLRWPS
jgi:hypothetical protein